MKHITLTITGLRCCVHPHLPAQGSVEHIEEIGPTTIVHEFHFCEGCLRTEPEFLYRKCKKWVVDNTRKLNPARRN